MAPQGRTLQLVYVDDVIIFSRGHQQHLQDLREVFLLIRVAGLKLWLEKAQIGKVEVEYLGHTVSTRGVCPSKKNIEKVKNWPTPTDRARLRTFVFLYNYYRSFVSGFARIAHPLNEFLQPFDEKGQLRPFVWTAEANAAFQELRRRLTEPPVLCFPNMHTPFIVKPDACDVSIGGVLVQIKDGKERVVAYASRRLQGAELNYGMPEKEALAGLFCCRHWRHYLLGSSVFLRVIQTDHKPNLAMKKNKLANKRVEKWALELQEYGLQYLYKERKSHTDADAVSRMPMPAEHSVDTGAPFCRHCSRPVDGGSAESLGFEAAIAGATGNALPMQAALPFLEKVRSSVPSDPTVRDVYEYLKTGTLPTERNRMKTVMAQESLFDLRGGLLYRYVGETEQLYVPAHLRETVIVMHHDHPMGGHIAGRRLAERLLREFW
uniref:Reverse transcriptase domain-containing protein n=1 Tax=Chromera velia CCMP2878 TaxID=1169474 RepID=A0A0G4GZ48_9ALVE|eukprot:Cvel_23932.t1-p1 / transcript=Cvel_23932.t1 / gene=Cvel_23932 / organism=Chromera_velia_CCMP2878 / gene_product=Retrovirus-related Pol polyprotein from transposon, putative / transcript_product=Retrovirus-related Pol polyprotein from transposon, putative / location=Cvel_scaffold2527:21445-22743(-) / protein_length=433 / sequence_SO=supercontig / SO=protein_coding / is_pseudo=false